MSTFEDANCTGVDPEAFFPSEHDLAGLKAAKTICKGCPVAAACLEFAMDNEMSTIRFGVYGGLSPRQRGNLGRARRAA